MLQDHFLSLTLAVLVMWTSAAIAQAPQQQHPPGMENERQHGMQSSAKSFSEQVGDLSRQVSELEAVVREQGVDAAAMKAKGDERRSKMSMGTLGGVPQTLLGQLLPSAQVTPNAPPASQVMGGM